MLATLRTQVDGLFTAAGIEGVSYPARLIALALTLGGAVFAIVVFLLDLLSAHPSSTSALIFPAVALYTAVAVGLVAGIDSGVRSFLQGRRPSGS